jgi:hypothetical protein
VFAFANVMHFFAHKFSGLRRSGLALPPVATGASERLLFRHKNS